MKSIFGRWRQFQLVPLALLTVLGALEAPEAHAGGVDFKQASNKNPALGNVIWINSILQQNNSRYFEGLSTLQRLVVLDIPPAPASAGSDHHSLTFSHEASKSGLHAYDFLTSWEQARAASMAYAGSDVFAQLNADGGNLTSSSTGEIIRQLRNGSYQFAVVAPKNMGTVENDDVQTRANAYALKFGERVIRLYGDAPIASAELRFTGYSGNTDRFAEYTLFWVSTSTNLLVEMAGHLAIGGAAGNTLGYGPGRGSASINGGPYHFKLSTLDGASLGSQDNQIKGADILVPPPVIALSSAAQNICAGSGPATFTVNVTADGTAPFSYAWTGPNGFTSNAPTISVHVAGTYSVIVTDANGLSAPALSAVVTVSACPVVTISGEPITCAKPQVELVAQSSASNLVYQWSGPGIVSGGDRERVTVNLPGDYSVIVADANGCSSTKNVVVVENKIQPDAFADGGTLTCANPEIRLRASSATPGALFQWSGTGLLSGGDTATPSVNKSGTYQVLITDPINGCSATATAIVNENKTAPMATLTGGILDCNHPQITLSAVSSLANCNFNWQGPGIVSGANSSSPVVSQPGNYVVTVVNPVNGCSAVASVAVSENKTAPSVSVAGGVLTCVQKEVRLSVTSSTSGAKYSWSGPGLLGGGDTASPLINKAGDYTVTVQDPANGCSSMAVATVTENLTAPAISATGATLTCAKPEVSLHASSTTAGATFRWSGPGILSGSETDSPMVNAPGAYLVTVTDPVNGCMTTASVNVMEDKLPPVVSATGATLTCAQPNATLWAVSSSATSTFVWTGPGLVSGADSATPSVNQPGTYTVSVMDSHNGCSATTTAVVSENKTAPQISATGGTLTCGQLDLVLQATSSVSGLTFVWQGPGILDGADTSHPTVNKPGEYIVTAVDPVNGCGTVTNVIVTENKTAPDVTTSGGVLTCTKLELILNADSQTAGATFSWTGPGILAGATSAHVTVNAPGTYLVTVLDPFNGCSSIGTAVVTENKTAPTVTAEGGVLTCAQRTLNLRASCSIINGSFIWTGPGILAGANSSTPTINAPGVYTVVVTDSLNGCSSSSTATVTQDTSAPEVTARGTVMTCTQTQAVISATVTKPGATCLWSGPGIVSGERTGECVINAPGLYSIAVTDPANGCSTTKSVSVTQEAPLPVTLGCPTSNGQIGVNYYSSLVAGGGVPPYTISIIGGSLPGGLTLTPSTGALTGVPTVPGHFGFTAQVVDSRASSITINCQITIVGNGGYRVTGGSNRETNMFQARCITTALPTFVSHGGQVGAAYSVATPFNPNSECISGEWQHNRHLRGNSLVGNLHASGNGNVHQFDSLLGACLPCAEDRGAVGVVGGVCNPGSRTCGPEPRRAPGNKICFSGVGDYTFTTGNKTVKAVFRVDIEDRSEGNGPSSSQPSDRYRIRIWLLDSSCGRNPDPDSAEAMALRYAASADPDKIAVLATTEDLKVNIPPDIDDGGNMTQGNHQIHPETGAQCGESAYNPPLLKTVRGAGGTIVATWPAVHSNYVLQTSSSMTSTNWVNVTITPVLLKNRCMVTNQISNGIQLFRLKKR